MKPSLLQRIESKRILPVATVERLEDALPLAEAVLAGGLDLIEITLRTEAALPAIEKIRGSFPEMLVGAGTVLTEEQVERVAEAGAQFGVAPGLNEVVVRHARSIGLPFIPGVMTPSEIERALALDCRLLKFFPAEIAGGAPMLESLSGPYAATGVRFIPLGGVRPANAAQYLALPIVAAIGGSWMVDRTLIDSKDWDTVKRRTKEILEIGARTQSSDHG